jgi:hypothetical protein
LNGTYTVALTVTDNDDLTDTTTKTLNDVIPEFPSWTPLLILLVAVMAVSVIYKRKLQNHRKWK